MHGIIWFHMVAALFAVMLGTINLVAKKGTAQHKFLGKIWGFLMLGVIMSSFWIRELNHGSFSWIHGLSAWTLFSITVAFVAIWKKKIRLHQFFMVGTMIGTITAGVFAALPGRFISTLLGY